MTGPGPGWTETTISGVDYWVMPSLLRVPKNWDPSSGVGVFVAPPSIGVGSFPAAVKGDPGDPAVIQDVADLTPLAWNDPTPASLTFTTVSPGVYQAVASLHEGEPGADGTTTVDLSHYGTPTPTYLLVVDSTGTTLVYQAQKVASRWIPATLNAVPSGNTNFTVATVSVPAQNFDWRPRPHGYVVVTGTGPNVQVDLICRLNSETGGNIVGRATQPAGQYPGTHVIAPGPPAGSADSYDKVSAGSAATVYLRTERQSGTDSYTTTTAQTQFDVEVLPI